MAAPDRAGHSRAGDQPLRRQRRLHFGHLSPGHDPDARSRHGLGALHLRLEPDQPAGPGRGRRRGGLRLARARPGDGQHRGGRAECLRPHRLSADVGDRRQLPERPGPVLLLSTRVSPTTSGTTPTATTPRRSRRPRTSSVMSGRWSPATRTASASGASASNRTAASSGREPGGSSPRASSQPATARPRRSTQGSPLSAPTTTW